MPYLQRDIGLVALGQDGPTAAGKDLAGHLARRHPGARLSWRRIDAEAPEEAH